MSIFQTWYDAIKNYQPPKWVKILLGQLQDLMIVILKQAGQQYIDFLKAEIIYAAGQNWTSDEKFNYVFKRGKDGLSDFMITLKDNEIQCIINFIVAQFKKDEVI